MKKIEDRGIEYLYKGDDLYSIIIRDRYENESVTFFTPDSFSQQLGFLPHKKGNVIKPHRHRLNKREVLHTQEVLLIKRGQVKVNFFDQENRYLHSEILNSGDVILLSGGGHGFEILEDSIMIEVKQGPYTDDESDKERFDGNEG